MRTKETFATGGILIALLLASCGDSEVPPTTGGALPCTTTSDLLQPPKNTVAVHADEVVNAKSWEELILASELVVVGRVSGAEPADFIPDGPDGEGVQMEHLKVDVLEVLHGSVADAQISVRQSVLDHGQVPVTNGLAPAKVDECALFFLTPSSAAEAWTITSSQGRYTVDSTGQLSGAEGGATEAPVVAEIEQMKLPSIIEASRQLSFEKDQ